nr:hypothetical protein [Tanacetum cinerariifolium]
MPWRHGDTDLHDDFLVGYDDHDVARLSEFLMPLRPPPRHLLYVCGLTTVCRHPELRYDIKDQDKNVIDMDTFLKLPSCTGIIVSRGDPIPEDQRPKPWVTPPLGTGVKIPEAAEGTKKKRKVQKHHELIQSGLEEILSFTPLHQAPPETSKNPTPVVDVTQGTSHIKKEVVNLSGNTRVPTPPAAMVLPSPRTIVMLWILVRRRLPYRRRKNYSTGKKEEHELNERKLRDSSQCFHQGHEDELVNNQAVCLSPKGTLKRHEQLSHDYVDLVNRSDANLAELDRLRLSLQKENQNNDGLGNKLSLLDSAHSECSSHEKELIDRVKDLEREKDEWRATASNQVEKIRRLEKDLEPKTQQLKVAEEKIGGLKHEKLSLSAEVAQDEVDCQQLVWEFIPTVVKRLHASVEYRKSLAAPSQNHHQNPSIILTLYQNHMDPSNHVLFPWSNGIPLDCQGGNGGGEGGNNLRGCDFPMSWVCRGWGMVLAGNV